MNYLEQIAQRIWSISEDGTDQPYPPEEAALWLGYAVLALAKGETTTSEDVHDAWTAWATAHYPFQHRSCIPFDELTAEVQAYDDGYRDAIHQAAREHVKEAA